MIEARIEDFKELITIAKIAREYKLKPIILIENPDLVSISRSMNLSISHFEEHCTIDIITLSNNKGVDILSVEFHYKDDGSCKKYDELIFRETIKKKLPIREIRCTDLTKGFCYLV